MSFLDQLKQTNNVAYTRNGAKSNKSTLDPVLDFFSKAGAMRGDIPKAVKLFQKAYAKDQLLAVRCLFYLRDIRGGQGERDLFRACLQALEDIDETVAKSILHFVPEYGRWDDLFSVRNSESLGELVQLISEQIRQDEANLASFKPVSLLAKWLPSENASSKKSRELARSFASLLGWTPVEYRKRVVALRQHIKLLEQQMSTKQWGEINYEKIPSQAHRKHVKAFKRNDEKRYTEYLGAVEKGEKKINVNTLYTYEVFDTVGVDQAAANAMWANLPDYTNGKNALVIADVSGSMYGRPLSISVSLALYFAEHNKGPFHNYFMTFSDTPELHQVLGKTLAQKLGNIASDDWEMSTNLEAAFEAILDAALRDKATADEMPAVLYIISDMQFNSCVNTTMTNFNHAKARFEANGYKLPHVVFWNVNAHDESPATMYDNGVTLISGSAQSTFKYAVEGKTPIESMADILNSERYAQITLEPVEKSLEDIPF
jgi:hypothetical protein